MTETLDFSQFPIQIAQARDDIAMLRSFVEPLQKSQRRPEFVEFADQYFADIPTTDSAAIIIAAMRRRFDHLKDFYIADMHIDLDMLINAATQMRYGRVVGACYSALIEENGPNATLEQGIVVAQSTIRAAHGRYNKLGETINTNFVEHTVAGYDTKPYIEKTGKARLIAAHLTDPITVEEASPERLTGLGYEIAHACLKLSLDKSRKYIDWAKMELGCHQTLPLPKPGTPPMPDAAEHFAAEKGNLLSLLDEAQTAIDEAADFQKQLTTQTRMATRLRQGQGARPS